MLIVTIESNSKIIRYLMLCALSSTYNESIWLFNLVRVAVLLNSFNLLLILVFGAVFGNVLVMV